LEIEDHFRLRREYYASLGRLLLANDENTEEDFMRFLKPFNLIFSRLQSITAEEEFKRHEVKVYILSTIGTYILIC
jgi:hypothetical protein